MWVMFSGVHAPGHLSPYLYKLSYTEYKDTQMTLLLLSQDVLKSLVVWDCVEVGIDVMFAVL